MENEPSSHKSRFLTKKEIEASKAGKFELARKKIGEIEFKSAAQAQERANQLEREEQERVRALQEEARLDKESSLVFNRIRPQIIPLLHMVNEKVLEDKGEVLDWRMVNLDPHVHEVVSRSRDSDGFPDDTTYDYPHQNSNLETVLELPHKGRKITIFTTKHEQFSESYSSYSEGEWKWKERTTPRAQIFIVSSKMNEDVCSFSSRGIDLHSKSDDEILEEIKDGILDKVIWIYKRS